MKNVQWCDWDLEGLEFCSFNKSEDGWLLEGVVIGSRNSKYGARYSVHVDTKFITREVKVDYIGGASLHVSHNAQGAWHDCLRDEPILSLTGCNDVDIGVTPATNMLPIRRLNLAKEKGLEIDVAYVPLPTEVKGNFLPRLARQRYTCLEPGRRYRYEGILRNFVAELEVDCDGLVLDYPETFRRII